MEIVKEETENKEQVTHNLAFLEPLKREDIQGKTIEEIRDLMEPNITTITDALNGYSKDELAATEQELMEEFKSNDEYLRARTYQLPESTTFDNKEYTLKDISSILTSLLDLLEVDFKTSLGVYQAIKFWRQYTKVAPVPYAVLDTTLRLLGLLKFKGYKQLQSVLVVNQWFTSVHTELIADLTWTEYLHTIHNAILQIINPQQNAPQPQVSVQ